MWPLVFCAFSTRLLMRIEAWLKVSSRSRMQVHIRLHSVTSVVDQNQSLGACL
ncbi:hypothetical protein CY34DRAFT_809396 [Suillus luteus UH-Slu-Lm8-n1]|uniref:Uncharacterized protein n=1 Tax=Suillus luteus UH-Slu-Lm8-n1 TaxID=930992 RepID=A0A0D0AVG8_9AGAM|nr:hypothetical protein CY34DRAFT_809396 [Suillus luteus UH-Slu-Lm8-n1]